MRAAVIRTALMAMDTAAVLHRAVQAICVVICLLRIRCANVWEATCVHACKGKNNGV